MRKLNLETLVVPPVYSNCYILADELGNTVVIDPGGLAEEILKIVQDRGLKVEAILNTHGHIDHIGANVEVRRGTGAPITVHEKDVEMLGSALLCGAEWMGIEFEPHEEDSRFVPGEVWDTGHFQFQVIHTPGHSPGSVCLILEDAGIVFSGDLVFLDSVGRWDLPGGNETILRESLREFLKLPDEMQVFPGHGAATTVGRERQHNPYVRLMR